MKVTQEERFKRIIIIIDDEEEADMIWHKLFSGGDWDDYSNRYRLSESKRSAMFHEFNQVYRPKGI